MNKPALAWSFYDWANSPFATVITTFVFATYFTQMIAPTPEEGTVLWGYAISLAGFIIAVSGPVLGAWADQTGYHKRYVLFFSFICIISSGALYFATPTKESIGLVLILVTIATVGFEVATVFYNAMLPRIAKENDWGQISGWAWGLGYAGGLVCLLLCLGIIYKPPTWLQGSASEPVRFTAVIVSIWFSIFLIPFVYGVAEVIPKEPISFFTTWSRVIRQLKNTLTPVQSSLAIFKFLLARMLYTDGINTIFSFGGIFAAGTFGMSVLQVMWFGIGLNVTAGLGAAGFAWLDKRLGAKQTILIALWGIIICAIIIFTLHSTLLFCMVALIMGLFFGPAQAASRTLMAQLCPVDSRNEMFGLYAFSGKATAFVGPWLLAVVTQITHNQRYGMLSILLFLIPGALLLYCVSDPR